MAEAKLPTPFANTIVGGQGGKAKGNARLAAGAGGMLSKNSSSKEEKSKKERQKAQDDIIDYMADYNTSMNSGDRRSYAKNEKLLKNSLAKYYEKYGEDSIEKVDSHQLSDGSIAFELHFKGEDHGYMIYNNYVLKLDDNK